MADPARNLYLTVEQAHALVPGRSLSWVYQHMRRAGGAALEGALGDLERWAADANASGVVAAETVPAPAFPEPDTKDVVISIPTVVWDELSPDALEKLHLPPGVTSTLSWFTGQTHTETAVLTADSARAVGRVCEELGLVCADVTAGRRYGIECTVWTVGRAAPKGGV